MELKTELGQEARGGTWHSYKEGASFKVRKWGTPEWYSAYDAAKAPFAKKLKKLRSVEMLPGAAQNKIMASALANGLVVDWRGITVNGNEVTTYDADLMAKSLSCDEDLRDFIMDCADYEEDAQNIMDKAVAKV